VLARRNRVRLGADFKRAIRTGRRRGRTRLVVHLQVDSAQQHGSIDQVDPVDPPPRAGFVVSKAVGGAVVRNTVTRRLRALVGQRLADLPAGSLLVVRALPPAATATSAELAADLDACLAGVLPAVRP